jgi:hypothetical protein
MICFRPFEECFSAYETKSKDDEFRHAVSQSFPSVTQKTSTVQSMRGGLDYSDKCPKEIVSGSLVTYRDQSPDG